MANSSVAFGMRASQSQGYTNTQMTEYAHDSGDSTALFIGDPVITTAKGGTSAAGAQLNDGTQIVSASGTITTTAIRGAVAGVHPKYSDLSVQYCPASTELGIYVYDDPFQKFEIMSNGTMVIDDVGDTMGITTGSGSTTTGYSAYAATESTGHADAADVIRILRLAPIVNNTLGLNSVMEVTVNLHELLTTTTA